MCAAIHCFCLTWKSCITCLAMKICEIKPGSVMNLNKLYWNVLLLTASAVWPLHSNLVLVYHAVCSFSLCDVLLFETPNSLILWNVLNVGVLEKSDCHIISAGIKMYTLPEHCVSIFPCLTVIRGCTYSICKMYWKEKAWPMWKMQCGK